MSNMFTEYHWMLKYTPYYITFSMYSIQLMLLSHREHHSISIPISFLSQIMFLFIMHSITNVTYSTFHNLCIKQFVITAYNILYCH